MNWKYVPLLFLFLFGVATTVVADVSHFDVPVVETECVRSKEEFFLAEDI